MVSLFFRVYYGASHIGEVHRLSLGGRRQKAEGRGQEEYTSLF